jgi:proliferating cell nuclear antigen PCNA
MRLEFNPKHFSDVISVISQLVTEVNIKVKADGLSIVALDPVNVAMVIFEMPKTDFDVYEAEDESLAVNLEDLKSVLKRLEKAEKIVLEKTDNMLSIYSKDGIRRKFSLALINLEEEERQKLKLNFTASIEMASDLFANAVEDALIVSDACNFITAKDSFTILASGTLNKSEITFSADEVKISGEGKAKYSLEYLEKFTKASKIFGKVKLSYKTDSPLQLDFFDDSLAMKLSFILAPRSSEEE